MSEKHAGRHAMPAQPAEERIKNFEEVNLGYDVRTAAAEAERCLQCKTKPCVSGCPVGIDIPGFIKNIRELRFGDAYALIHEASSLPAVCGRVCPQETQCEGKCVRGAKGEPVAIGNLERFVADWHAEHSGTDRQSSGDKTFGTRVAVIGSGPAGLTCAGELARMGYTVTVFEALHRAGGVLVYGIPEFRLPKAVVDREIRELADMGVRFEMNAVIGRLLTVDELIKDMGFAAVFIGSGAGLPRFMGIPGEALNGVYSANEYLTRVNLMKAYEKDSPTPITHGKRICVVGGGNVAMDAARCARRLGAKVTVVYRRTEKELPARREEYRHALEEGIEFKFLTNPVRIIGNEHGWVSGMSCQQMRLGEPDQSGRRKPVAIPGTEETIDSDTVIMALGTSPNPLIRDTTEGLEVTRRGVIVANEETGATSREGVFAGGDAVTGSATVILAMGAGKRAAAAIDQYLRDKEA